MVNEALFIYWPLNGAFRVTKSDFNSRHSHVYICAEPTTSRLDHWTQTSHLADKIENGFFQHGFFKDECRSKISEWLGSFLFGSMVEDMIRWWVGWFPYWEIENHLKVYLDRTEWLTWAWGPAGKMLWSASSLRGVIMWANNKTHTLQMLRVTSRP